MLNGVDEMLIAKLLTGLLLTAAVSGCAASPQKQPVQGEREKTVYVVSHGGWHTGIVIAAQDLGAELAFLKRYFDDAGWYEIGWGDKQFYQAEKVTAGIALRAGLVPTDTVLHVTALPERPDSYFSGNRVIELHLDAAGHERMTAAIAKFFVLDDNGSPLPSGKGLYGQSLFFDATGRFHLFNTCNTWTASMVQQAGLPVSTVMTFRADSVMKQLEPLAVSDTGMKNERSP